MNNHTLKDLEKSPNTLIQFFLKQGIAKIEMIDDAYIFYITFSSHKDRKNGKNFKSRFLKDLKFFNSIKN